LGTTSVDGMCKTPINMCHLKTYWLDMAKASGLKKKCKIMNGMNGVNILPVQTQIGQLGCPHFQLQPPTQFSHQTLFNFITNLPNFIGLYKITWIPCYG